MFEFAIAIKASVVLVFAGFTAALLRRAPASARHAVWSIAFLCLLAQPLVSVLWPQTALVEVPLLREPRPDSTTDTISSSAPASENPALAVPDVVPAASTGTVAATAWSARQWLTLIWMIGLVAVMFQVLAAAWSARRLARQTRRVSDSGWIRLLEQLKRELSIPYAVDLRMGGELPPMAWGVLRSVILLPAAAQEWTGDRRRAVLAHELAHIRRRDGLMQILVQIACSLYWFNPLVWFAERRMRLERERACDDYVLNLGTGSVPYADHLLELARGVHHNAGLTTIPMAHPSQLESRLRAILNPRLRRGNVSRWTAALLASSLTVLMFCLAAIHVTSLLTLALPAIAAPAVPVPSAEPAPGPPTVQPIIQKVGAIAGQALWADGPPAVGARITVIAVTPPNPSNREWVAGERVAAQTVTDIAGRFRVEALAAGQYHVVPGPAYLPQFFSDVADAGSKRLVTLKAGEVVSNLEFAIVRNPDKLPVVPGKVITVTGVISMKNFASSGGGLFLLVPNSDGSVMRWHIRGEYPGGRAQRYWWPPYSQMSYERSPIAEMVRDGETVTMSGVEIETWGNNGNPGLVGTRALNPSEITRGGK